MQSEIQNAFTVCYTSTVNKKFAVMLPKLIENIWGENLICEIKYYFSLTKPNFCDIKNNNRPNPFIF